MTFRKQTLLLSRQSLSGKWLSRQPLSGRQAHPSRLALAALATALAVILSACSNTVSTPKATASGPQVYMTPTISGGVANASGVDGNLSSLGTFSIDDKALSFAQEMHTTQSVAQITYSGDLASPDLKRGLEELELAYACGATSAGGIATCPGISYTPSASNPSGWAVELAGQAGGLAQLTGNAVTPMVPAVTCPSMSSPETFLFVTLPTIMITTGTGGIASGHQIWNPNLETAYGSADISASGSTVTYANIKQNILPSAGGGTPANAPSSSLAGPCSSTVFGNTVAVPANPTVTIGPPGITNGPQAIVGIGPSGLLIEDNGNQDTSFSYENLLGAGSGAIGLPKPSSAVGTSALVGAQYLGFFFGSGYEPYESAFNSYGSPINGFTSVASFGFPSPTTCVAPQTSTMIYGGDFPGNNPAAQTVQANGGFGNCDFAIDLGAQDSSTNGLFPAATVYVGSGFAENTTGNNYSFPAVAIAGQLNGKYAIFLIGEDTVGTPNQGWGIYLLQSN